MANTVYQPAQIKVKIKGDGGLQATTPITLRSAAGSSSSLDKLTDVSITNLANNDIIVYDGTANQWTNHVPPILTGNGQQTVVTNSTPFSYQVSLANNVVIANNISVGLDFYVNNGVTYIATANIINATFGNTSIAGSSNVSGNLTVTGTFYGNNVSLTGDLVVNGTTTYINTTNLNIGDNIITLNADLSSTTPPTENAGLEVNRGNEANVQFIWSESGDEWLIGNTSVTGYVNVSSTANIGGVLTARANIVSNGQLIVSNVASLGNTTVTGFINVSTTANVGGVANFRANVVSNGILTVANSISVGNTGITGYINVSTTANVGGVANFRANVVANGTLIVSNNISVGNIAGTNTDITGYINVSSTANVGGVANFRANVVANGQLIVSNAASLGNTEIAGYINVSSTANVGGVANFRANVVANGTLIVSNNISVGNIAGTDTDITGYINVSSTANVGGVANFRANVVANGTLTVANSISVGNIAGTDTDITGYINVSSTANVGGVANFRSNVVANGVLTVANSISVGNIAGTNTDITGYINVSSTANVGGVANFRSDVVANGALTVANTASLGNTTITGFANVVGNIAVSDTISGKDMTLTGNLTVNGTTTYINTTTLDVGDNIITLNADITSSTPPTENAGIEVNRGNEANVQFVWDESNDRWTAGNVAFSNTDIAGYINVSSTANVGGVANFRANVVANGQLIVSNTVQVGNTTVTGFINVSSTANVGGVANFRANVVSNGVLIVANTVQTGNTDITGYINVSTTANVGGVANFRANVVANGVLIVSNTVQTGNTTITGFINVSSTANVGGEITARANVTVNGAFTVSNVASVGNTTVTGFINVSSTANVGGVANFRANVVSNGVLIVANTVQAGNTDITGYINVSSTANVGDVANFRANVVANGQLIVSNAASLGNTTITGFINVSSTANVGGNLYVSTITTSGTNANLILDPNGTGVVVIANASGGAVGIEMGTPSLGVLVSNAVSLTTNTSITDGVAQLNKVLGKLVPPSPTAFPNGSISVVGTSSYRMTNFTQTDNTPSSRNVAGGTTVTVLRTSTFTTSNVINSGPGDSGTVTAYFNNVASGSVTLSTALTPNTTNGSLRFFNNLDYNTVNNQIAAGFWSVFSANGSGSAVPAGWNEFKIGHSAAGNTNTVAWYYDNAAPGSPVFSSTSFVSLMPSYTYSSSIAHYNNTSMWVAQFYAAKLSGDVYPTSDTFATGTAGGAFLAPASATYADVGIVTPLARNLFVASGNSGVVTMNTYVASGFGQSSAGPQVTLNNGYSTQANTFSPGGTVLYKTGLNNNITTIEEANVYFGSTVGTGAGAASRIINPGSTDTPTYTASATLFNSQSSTLQTYDATIVGGVLRHDQTNYITYLPSGPNLSIGRTGSQYFTFKFVRTSLQKFDIRYTGTIAGMWVAMPGSTIDSTSTLNGWLDCSIAYNNTGTPGANTAAGGNGTNGCGLSNLAVLNSAQTNKNVTATFGPVSTSSTATNEVYVRIKLTSGQSVTALSLQTFSA